MNRPSITLLTFTTTLALLVPACGSAHEAEPALQHALQATVTALHAQDMDALWNLTDTPTQGALLSLLRDLEAARSRVDVVWPDARQDALAALGASLAPTLGPDDAGRGPRLLRAVLDTSSMRASPETEDGLTARNIVYEPGPPERATYFTSAGDVFTFTRDGDAWRSTVVRDHVLDTPSTKLLRDNAAKTLALAAEYDRTWRLSEDPRTPQGAFNLARRAQTRKPPDVDALYALIDQATRDTLLRALDKGREAQRAIQRRTPKAQRRAAYDAAAITRLVDSTSDLDLFRRWSASPDFVLPLTALDPPRSIDGDSQEGEVRVVTDSGARATMKREPDGFWRVSGLQATVERLFLRPAEAALTPAP